MKYTTMSEIIELEQLIAAKTDRINALNRMIIDIRSKYKGMTNSQLEEAVRDVAGMRRDIADEKQWCDQAQAKIAEFFAPASK